MTSTFIGLPPPPSDPVTPSEVPGTPNSGTTSLSALSTVAIKDGHQGHSQHSHHYHHTDRPTSNSTNTSTTTLDAERADRISRLAGLERVSTVRQSGNNHNTSAGASTVQQTPNQPIGYFDAAGNPALAKERSTVGSASATGSMGGRTTWASGSDIYETDKMSEDNTDALSQSGISDDANASLVGFGEGANSVVDGPTSNASVPISTAAARLAAQQAAQQGGPTRWKGEPDGMQGVLSEQQRARNIDGMTYDRDATDTAARNPIPAAPGSAQGTPAPRHAGLSGRETTERIVQERYGKRDQDIDMEGNE